MGFKAWKSPQSGLRLTLIGVAVSAVCVGLIVATWDRRASVASQSQHDPVEPRARSQIDEPLSRLVASQSIGSGRPAGKDEPSRLRGDAGGGSGTDVILVETVKDAADIPFVSDLPCGSGTVAELPGADGVTTFREAIAAANNTRGPQKILFSGAALGGRIVVEFDDSDSDTLPEVLPAICDGGTSIAGDLHDDRIPGVALDGSKLQRAQPGLAIRADRVTVAGLHFERFGIGITVSAGGEGNARTLSDAVIRHNVISDSVEGVVVETRGQAGSITRARLFNNRVVRCSATGILLRTAGNSGRISETDVRTNEIAGCGQGILVISEGDHNSIARTRISGNRIDQSASQSLHVMGGNLNADHNSIVDMEVVGNRIRDGRNSGIRVVSGQDNSSDNSVAATVRSNVLEGNFFIGILAFAGEGALSRLDATSSRNNLEIVVEDNHVLDQIGFGMAFAGGAGSPEGRPGGVANNNRAVATVRRNKVLFSSLEAAHLMAGYGGPASENVLHVAFSGNVICSNGWVRGEAGFLGGANAPNRGRDNRLTGRIEGNLADPITILDGTPGNRATVAVRDNSPCSLLGL